MKRAVPITTLFLDIGGVLLTDAWDHNARRRGAKNFKLDWDEREDRHRVAFETHEQGKLSKPYPETIELFAQLKIRHGRSGDSKHTPYGLQIHLRKTGFVRIEQEK
jgi:hypothetical protein